LGAQNALLKELLIPHVRQQ